MTDEPQVSQSSTPPPHTISRAVVVCRARSDRGTATSDTRAPWLESALASPGCAARRLSRARLRAAIRMARPARPATRLSSTVATFDVVDDVEELAGVSSPPSLTIVLAARGDTADPHRQRQPRRPRTAERLAPVERRAGEDHRLRRVAPPAPTARAARLLGPRPARGKPEMSVDVHESRLEDEEPDLGVEPTLGLPRPSLRGHP